MNPIHQNYITSTNAGWLEERKSSKTTTLVYDLSAIDSFRDQVFASVSRQVISRQFNVISSFMKLRDEWYDAMKICSGGDERFMHPAYQRIIGLGPDVIPSILHELSANGAAWNWALKALTGANPVKPESRGRSKKIAQDWLDWAEKNGINSA